MSIHYLIDPFTVNGDIIDVVTAESGQTDATGATLVRVPDGVAIDSNPSNLSDLLTQKYDGLLATYAGFTYITADSCMGNSTTFYSNVFPFLFPKLCLVSNGYVNHSLLPFGLWASVTINLPVIPTQGIMTWETYSFTEVDDKTGRYQRVYTETDPDLFQCSVSFDNGVNFSTVTDGSVLNIPVGEQGDQFQVRFTNNSGSRLYLGSWALIY